MGKPTISLFSFPACLVWMLGVVLILAGCISTVLYNETPGYQSELFHLQMERGQAFSMYGADSQEVKNIDVKIAALERRGRQVHREEIDVEMTMTLMQGLTSAAQHDAANQAAQQAGQNVATSQAQQAAAQAAAQQAAQNTTHSTGGSGPVGPPGGHRPHIRPQPQPAAVAVPHTP